MISTMNPTAIKPTLYERARRRLALLLALVAGTACDLGLADPRPAALRGTVRFQPSAAEPSVPEAFRLEAAEFPYERIPQETVSKRFTISLLTFPSPVVTPHPNNNIVHCEYFRPVGDGQHPAVVVLHIMGGDFDLSRLFARELAHHGVAALFLKMPYYGPRRQPGASARMVSDDPRATVAGMRQAVLDIRRAATWLAAQDEVDDQRLGVFGISLGGITAALAGSVGPEFSMVCSMLAGGNIAEVGWTAPELQRWRERWQAEGGSRESFFELMRTIDPVTYARPAAGRRMLMLNAERDEVIPRRFALALWQAFGEPPIVWYDAGHYSVVVYIFDGLGRVREFFRTADAPRPTPRL